MNQTQTQTEFARSNHTPQTAEKRNQRQILEQRPVRLVNTEPNSTLYVFSPNVSDSPDVSNNLNSRNTKKTHQQQLPPPRKDNGTAAYLAPPRQQNLLQQKSGSVAVIPVPVKPQLNSQSKSVIQRPRDNNNDNNKNVNIKNEMKKLPPVKRLAAQFKKSGLGIIDSYFNACFFYCQYYKSKSEKSEKTEAQTRKYGKYGVYLVFLTFIASLWGFILDLLSPVRSLIKLVKEFWVELGQSVKAPKSIWAISRKICGFAVPAAAVAFTIMTIANISAFKPEIELSFDGQAVGFVDSKETVAKVVSLIENNLSSVLNEQYEFSGNLSYRIVLVKDASDSYISESELYYLMYSSSEAQGAVTQAYGLYIDGALVGAAESESEINKILNEVLEANSSEDGSETIQFANDIKIIPNNYATRDVVTQDELKNIINHSAENSDANINADAKTDLNSNSDEAINTQDSQNEQSLLAENAEPETPFNDGHNLLSPSDGQLKMAESNESNNGAEDIAAAAAAMSVNLAPETIDTIPRGFLNSPEDSEENQQHQSDLLSRLTKTAAGIAVSAIQFKKTKTETYTEETPFEVKYIESNQYFTGTQMVRTNGVNGESIITAEITYIGDSEVSREIREIEVIKEPVNKVVVIGTKAKPSVAPTGKFIRPVKGGYITSRHGNGHRGIDLVVPYGTSIMAADGGTVIYSGYSGSYGNHIKIRHSDGFVTIYAHNSSNLVKSGDKVFQGQEIGKVGSTGKSTGNHVHFEIMKNGVLVNPESYINK